MEWIKIPYRAAWRLVMDDEGLELSGYIAFTAFLSLFPFLIFLAALAGFLGDRETADGFIEAMFNFMPDDVAETLAPAVREVVGAREGGLLTFGILATLWFASNGFEALRTGLNRAYGVSEQRAMWWLRLQSIAFVISGGLIILFLSLVVILGPLVWKVLGPTVHSVLETRLLFGTARYLFAGVLLFGALTLLHRWLPNTRQAFAASCPGSGRPRCCGCSGPACSPGMSATLPTIPRITAASAGSRSPWCSSTSARSSSSSAPSSTRSGASAPAVGPRPRRPTGRRRMRRAEGGEHSRIAPGDRGGADPAMEGQRPRRVQGPRVSVDEANAGPCRDAHSRAQASTVRYEVRTA